MRGFFLIKIFFLFHYKTFFDGGSNFHQTELKTLLSIIKYGISKKIKYPLKIEPHKLMNLSPIMARKLFIFVLV